MDPTYSPINPRMNSWIPGEHGQGQYDRGDSWLCSALAGGEILGKDDESIKAAQRGNAYPCDHRQPGRRILADPRSSPARQDDRFHRIACPFTIEVLSATVDRYKAWIAATL
jgi:hypothetical protein